MTHTWQRASCAEIIPWPPALRWGSSPIPRYASSWQISARVSTEFSPMPPANTSVSIPPRAAAGAPIHFAPGSKKPPVRHERRIRHTSCQQIAHIGAGFGQPQQARLPVDQLVDLVGRHSLLAQQVNEHARVEIARAHFHHQPRGGRESHRRIHAATVAHRGHACAAAQMSQYDSPRGTLRTSQPQ